MNNILADESLQLSCSEKSFLVLLDHVDPEADGSDQAANKIIEIYELLRANRLLTAALAGVIVLVLLIGLMLSGNSGKEPQPQAPTEKTTKVLPLQQIEPQPPTVARNAEPASQAKEGVPAVPAEPQQSTAVQFEETEAAKPAPTRVEERRDGGKLYRERLGASSTWLAGALRGGYTIQLMMLVSDQAQASITKTLVQDDYYSLREQLYILRKKTNPPTLFVFYGIFDSMDAAREARNNMPVALRKHHPYPLAMSDALKKTEN
jgi:septal ring-binding cell division protein DamX